MVLAFAFGSVAHPVLIFVYGVRYGLSFFFPIKTFSYSNTTFEKTIFFLQWITLVIFSKIRLRFKCVCVCLLLGFLFFSFDLFVDLYLNAMLS